MRRPRVVVTGIGTISSAGRENGEFIGSLREAKRCFTPLEDDALRDLRASYAGLINDFNGASTDPEEVRNLDRVVHLALDALRESMGSAGLEGPLGPRAGIVFGTCSGGMLSIEKHFEALCRGEDNLDETLLFSKRYYSVAKVLAWAAGAAGPAVSVVTACAAGAGAIAQGADFIRSGMADVVFAGGGDAFAPSTLAGFDGFKATCEEMCAPFSTPVGLNLGEGAAFFVLERLEHAQTRQATLLAEVLGSGLSNDAYHPTAPDPSGKGQILAMQSALADGGLLPDQIDYVNAHGTGTRANDIAESRAIIKVLGEAAARVPVSGTKSIIGHCLGGAGALEAAATVLAARAGFVPPTGGFKEPREGCDLDYVPDRNRPWTGRIALSNSFGFAGNNACLALDVSPDPNRPAAEPSASCDDAIVITGIGAVYPGGVSNSISSDSVGRAPVEHRFELPTEPFDLALVPPIDVRKIDRRLDLKGMDLCSVYAVLAVREALIDAGIQLRPNTTSKIGAVLGITTGPSQGESDHLTAVFEHGFNLQSVGAFPYVVPNEVAGNLSRALMLRGHNTVLASGQGAGLAALISAATSIEQSRVDTVVAVSSDELSTRTVTDGHKAGLFGPGTGVVPGEGAATLVLERESAALERGATLLAEVVGYSMCTDPQAPTTGERAALARRALTGALESARLDLSEIRGIAVDPSLVDGSFAGWLRGACDPNVEFYSLCDEFGLAESSLPLFHLIEALRSRSSKDRVAVVHTSAEGFASCVVVELS